ncbi:hypothetical protein WA026_014232 [Henosepilachna vigintioctopunctata]|uniref:Secreted protein n=1 Tax=Henosepilachna vigintioctopunctata TaxID=420089 RepID=A0AAW1TTX9_9CUCU
MHAGNRSTRSTLRTPSVLLYASVLPHAPQPSPVGGLRRLGPGWQMPPRLYGQFDAESFILREFYVASSPTHPLLHLPTKVCSCVLSGEHGHLVYTVL